jgi:hypothetical protein
MRPSPEAFAFGVLGDTPYTAQEEAAFVEMMARIDRVPLAFVVHVGDIIGEACTDALLAKRRAQFEASVNPFVYTPGDNEWVDCAAPMLGGFDPLERLAKLRQLFFADDFSLGQRKIALEVQPVYRENRQWKVGRVRFVTLNYAGQDNNVGHNAAGDAEAGRRNEANRAWLAGAFDASGAADIAALVVITQANPWFTPNRAFDDLLAQMREGAEALRKPVLFVHGDTHIYRVDSPFRDVSGYPDRRLTRLETFGSPFVGWVRVVADPSRPDVFSFEPHLHALYEFPPVR